MQDLKFRKNRKRRHRPGKLEKKGLHFEKKAGHMRMQGKTRRVGRYARKDVIVWGAEKMCIRDSYGTVRGKAGCPGAGNWDHKLQ